MSQEAITPMDVRIAAVQRLGTITILQFDGQAELLPVFSVKLGNVLPISVTFASTKGREIQVFGLNDGIRYVSTQRTNSDVNSH